MLLLRALCDSSLPKGGVPGHSLARLTEVVIYIPGKSDLELHYMAVLAQLGEVRFGAITA